VLVRPVLVVEDRVRTLETVAREALFPEEIAGPIAEHDVVLGRDVAHLHPVQH
jgi:hypothetical protein